MQTGSVDVVVSGHTGHDTHRVVTVSLEGACVASPIPDVSYSKPLFCRRESRQLIRAERDDLCGSSLL
jgi:hypothetical protein